MIANLLQITVNLDDTDDSGDDGYRASFDIYGAPCRYSRGGSTSARVILFTPPAKDEACAMVDGCGYDAGVKPALLAKWIMRAQSGNRRNLQRLVDLACAAAEFGVEFEDEAA